jgi:L-lactate utilization protein LutB
MADVYGAARNLTQENLGRSAVKALTKRGYEAVFVSTKEMARDEVLKLIPSGSSVGVPGTVTIREIGIMEKLEERGCKVWHHWIPDLAGHERIDVLRHENRADYFLTSSNALTYDGVFVNIDGSGNRLSGMAWGDNTVIYVIGINKLAPTLEAAWARAHAATPANAARLNLPTPCAQTGFCVNCDSKARLCNVTLVQEYPPQNRKIHVILVGESLGY